MEGPRIGIVFYGIPRSGSIAYPNIIEKIILPAQSLGKVIIRYHFFDQKKVFNPLSGEDGCLPSSDYEPFFVHKGELSSPDIISSAFKIEKVISLGDAWGDNFMSTKNLLRQLYSLENVTRQILALSPDVVVFARPDLIYQDSLYASILSALQQHQRPIARVPFWHWASGGYNDRFSICSGRAIQAYGFRAKLIDSFLAEKRRSLHSELFLKYALDRSLVFVRRLDISASRIRLEGRVVKEKFSDVSGSRLIRHWIREACKHGIERL